MKKLNKQIHWEKAKGSKEANDAYVSKTSTHIDGPWEVGKPTKQGEKPKIDEFKNLIEDGGKVKDLWKNHFTLMMRHGKTVLDYVDILKKEKSSEKSKCRFTENWIVEKQKIPETGCLLIYGDTGLGKTEFALSHFENPVKVGFLEDLKNIELDEHDGIVFDDIDLRKLPPTQVIQLLDGVRDATIYARYKNIIIPAGMKKIFTFNESNPFYDPMTTPVKTINALERRIHRFEVLEKLFSVPSD